MTKPTNGTSEVKSTSISPLESKIIESIRNRKGSKITHISFKGLDTVPAESFIICQGSSTSQVSAIADNIREEVQRDLGVKPYNYDGYRNSQWIVIDYGNILVHVFLPDIREYYNIEDLWSDANLTEIPDLD